MSKELKTVFSSVVKPHLGEFSDCTDPKKLASQFKKSINALKRRTAFVPYRESHALAGEVMQLANDIVAQLMPVSADHAADLLEKLMATGVKSIERCDDSGGYLGHAYQEIVLLWLQAAANTEQAKSVWIKKIKTFKKTDDYALFDSLLPNVNILLNRAELRQLAVYYETELRRTKGQWKRLQAGVNVKAMAQALGDTELMERGLLGCSPEPNTLELDSLISFCLEQGDETRVLKWLNAKNDQNPDWLKLKINCFKRLGLDQNVAPLCAQLLDQQASFEHLQIAIKACPEQAELWQQKALVLLPTLEISVQVELLLSLQRPDQTLKVALENYDALRQCFYGKLINFLEQVPEESYLLKSVFYRCLLLDLLERGYSKAYHHAARYLRKLRDLDENITDYASLDSHQKLEDHLQEKHGRKSSFWALV